MEIERHMTASCPPATLFAYVEDLGRYPEWMPLVHAVDDDSVSGTGWNVELRAKVGPLARSKRLRMVRSVHEPDREVVFERAELDGRNHSPWVLRASLGPAESGTRLTMNLRYGGSLWTGGILERVLDDQVRQGSERLRDLVSDEPTP